MSDERGSRPTIQLEEFLPYRLSIASNAVSNLIARAYEERFQLRIPEWRLMAVLAEVKEATPQQLGRATRMDKISVSRAAKSLRGRGLLQPSPNAVDRRSHFLSLTEEGRALYARIAPLALELEAELLRHFSAAEISELEASLRRIEATALEALQSLADSRKA